MQAAKIPPPANNKDTIYIDIDDEITAIIDKVRASSSKVIALVLPKRATTFQSIVNMKLLKRAADNASKHLVLITNEIGLLPLAGAAGVHVAKTLTSKPEIPVPPNLEELPEETVDEDAAELDEFDSDSVADKPVGELAGAAAPLSAAPSFDDAVETIELDDDETPDDAAAAASAAIANKESKGRKHKKDPKLKVPNFERFRLLLIAIVLILVLLIIGVVYAAKVLPKAEIDITTDASNVNANFTLNLSTTATAVDASTDTVPAKLQQETKTYSQQVTTTGQQNNGQKATGTVAISAVECGTPTTPSDVPAGTLLTYDSNTYITQTDTSFSYNQIKKGCIYFSSVSNTPISAQAGGQTYNTGSNESFSISGRPDINQITGSANGGTDDIQQVVAQADIDSAKAKISTTDSTIEKDLENQLEQNNYYALPATYSAGTPAMTTSANVGDAADSVTFTETISYMMFGAHQADISSLIEDNVKGQINTSKQSITDDGLDKANYDVQNTSATGAQVTLSTTAVAGPELSENTIKQDAAGKKSGDVKSDLESDPDVTGVTVKLSPFWVTSVPNKATKITVNIAKPTNVASSASSNGDNP
jgi:hypothetical protein